MVKFLVTSIVLTIVYNIGYFIGRYHEKKEMQK